MTLAIEPHLQARRELLLAWVRQYRKRLLQAYISGDPVRIRQNKLSLARHLKELAESPELGPKLPFIWGGLEVVYQYGFDPTISWPDYLDAEDDWWKVARMLEASVFK